MKLTGAVPAASRALDFLAVGEASLDTICLTDTFPAPDTKLPALGVGTFPGGQAATAAIGVAKLGFRAGYAGAVGDDEGGREIEAALGVAGVTSHAVRRPGVRSRSAIVLVESGSGARAVIESRDRRLDLAPTDIADDVFRSARVVLVDASDIALAIRAARLARESGARTIVDIDTPRARAIELLNYIDVVIAPGPFVTELTGVPATDRALSELARSLPNAAAVIATLGAEGAMVSCGGELATVGATRVHAVDTTGAGDAYRAGFAAAWLAAADADPEREPQLEWILTFAAKAAALNCRAVGAQTALPTRVELFGPDGPPRL